MEMLAGLTPRQVGSLLMEPEVSFSDNNGVQAGADRCPITACDRTCMGTGNTS
ncbi:hypothetical protein PV664_34125 [Streptomyces sp. ME01-18a]|uniref:hypothetical protein n=1 Tax=Streptomyces sp. ME01-18a TaxID=3028669 RepID=UPI0029A4D6BE|nr:hypothetical protein [Streptomyces sp. ME01-18a]MDX3433921.1 hypothetical protein [Streptomyces sp. ME01-18a]